MPPFVTPIFHGLAWPWVGEFVVAQYDSHVFQPNIIWYIIANTLLVTVVNLRALVNGTFGDFNRGGS